MNLALDSRQLPRRSITRYLVLTALLGLTITALPSVVRADDKTAQISYAATTFATPGSPGSDATPNDDKVSDFFPELWTPLQKTPVLKMQSISPSQGPITGKERGG
jgi:hypothetical protein